MHAHLVLAIFVATVFGTSACTPSSSARPPTTSGAVPEPKLAAREKLPLAAREALTTRMERHGDRMILLMESVVLLNYELAQVLAEELAEDPKLGRPAEGEVNTLNALLPSAFFDYQDQLAERALVLQSAAAKRHDQELIAAFSSLAETCVGCHAAYLYEEDEAPGDQEPWLHDSAP